MKLYKFCFSKCRPTVNRYVLEVEEKPKTYMTTETCWRTRIGKSDIGTVDGFDNVYLLEDDERKAKEIFCEKLKGEIVRKKSCIEDVKKEIGKTEEIIAVLRGTEVTEDEQSED